MTMLPATTAGILLLLGLACLRDEGRRQGPGWIFRSALYAVLTLACCVLFLLLTLRGLPGR